MTTTKVNWFIRAFYVVTMPIILAACIFVMYIGYLFFFPPPAPIIYKEPMEVIDKTVEQGDPIELNVTRCSQESVFGVAAVQLVGPEIRILEDRRFFVEPGCVTVISKNNVAPDDLTPGTYKLVFVIEERTEGSQRYNDRVESESFEVVESTKLKEAQ